MDLTGKYSNGCQLLTLIQRIPFTIKLIIHFKENIICSVDLIIRFDIIFVNPLSNPLDKSGDKLGVLDLVGKGVS